MLKTFVALETNLARKLYGQHLVSNITIKYMNTNVKRKPSKALTFSFHGGSGTGKTDVSSIIFHLWDRIFTQPICSCVQGIFFL